MTGKFELVFVSNITKKINHSMGRHKRQQFINKKNAVTFHLVHRSQRDPLQADDESSKFVLQEAVNLNEKKATDEKRKEEQRKYGIFFEDDYDYTQHLREVQSEHVTWHAAPIGLDRPTRETDVQYADDTNSKAKIQLPAGAFGSSKEEDIGLLNRAAPISGPRLDLDPDVVAALDEDFDLDDPDNVLEDDFVIKAQDLESPEGDDGIAENNYFDSDDDGRDEEEFSSGGEYEREQFDDEEEETKTRFTNYSMSSSVIRRNEGLTLLDDRFEKIFEEYDDIEMGALDHDEIEGFVHDESEILQQVLTEFEESQKKLVLEKDDELVVHEDRESEDEGSIDAEEKERIRVEENKKERWDCESILSTYSNLYNHPKIIDDGPKQKKSDRLGDGTIRLSAKTGMPLGVLPAPGPTKKQLERQELDEYRLPLVFTPRKKGQKESKEEKKDRKQAIKAERKIRRIEKKVNKDAFKEEEKMQKKVMMNLRVNLQGVKVT